LEPGGWLAVGPCDRQGKKLHADLIPWEELSDKPKNKDRDFVLAIPGILAKAGYTVVELRPHEGRALIWSPLASAVTEI